MQKLKIFLSLLLVSSMFAMYVPQVHASGTWTQSDWSGGSGQSAWSDATKYNTSGGDGVKNTLATGELSMDQAANLVVGQADKTTGTSQNIATGHTSAYGLSLPKNAIVVGTKLIVSDGGNNRVLIWNSIPDSAATPADVVIGQIDMTHGSANQGGTVAANTLYSPFGLYSDGTKLLISDSGNHRVLIYNTIPVSDGASANTVIGQADMTHNSINQGSTVADNTLYSPAGISSDGTKLFIADFNNNRVLIYNNIPASDDASADTVIGQADMTHGSANQGSTVADNTLYQPYSVYYNNTKLYIADYNNNRVLIYNTIPVSDGASANTVIGQVDMTHGSANQGSTVTDNTLYRPNNIFSDGTKLFIADFFNYRVLIYNTIPVSDGASANTVIGQADMTHNSPNQGGTAPAANTLNRPSSIFYDGTNLYIADYSNDRVLIYNTIPAVDNTLADAVIGQQDFSANQSNNTFAFANSLSGPSQSAVINSKLIVSDALNNRILIYNTIPTTDNASADVVIGQENMTFNKSNDSSGLAAANSLNNPSHFWSDGTKLIVADTGNNRVLIYNSIPTGNNASADVVIGQADMTGCGANKSTDAFIQGGCMFSTPSPATADTLYSPSGVYSDGTKLFIADIGNNRVLIYNTIPTSDNASANIVIGQADMTHSSINQGGSVAANTLYYPNSVYSDGTKIFIADSGNNRVLIYNTIPTSNNASADVVIGQADMTHNSANQGGTVAANTLYYPNSVFSDGTKLFITSLQNNRVLIYNTIPTTDDASADTVIGQADFTHNSANRGSSVLANTVYRPFSVNAYGAALYVSDTYNNRLLIYSGPHQSTLTSSTFTSTTPDTTWGPLSYDATVPTNTSISFEYSGNGGTTWQTITDPANQSLGTSKTMTYRVTLSNTDGISTPILRSVSIAYTTATGGGGLAGGLPTTNPSASSGQTATATTTSGNTTNNPLANNTPANSSTTPNACQPGDKYDIYTGLPCTTTTATTNAGQTSLSITTSTNSCTITETLKQGSKGNDVKCLQRDLTITEDGLFGPKTKQSVISFQKDHNLTPDGVVGPKTRAVLNQ